MPWKKRPSSIDPDRYIDRYYRIRIDEVRTPQIPSWFATTLGDADADNVPRSHLRTLARRPTGLKRIPDLAFALFFAASFAVVGVNVGRPSLFAAHMIVRADEGQWGKVLPKALDEARKTVTSSFIGG